MPVPVQLDPERAAAAIDEAMSVTRMRQQGSDGERGFTLIELLVVIIVIGVLAAIAIPVYAGQQRSARDASVVTDVHTSTTLVGAWVLDNQGTAVTNTTDYLAAGGKMSQSSGNVINVTTRGTGAYTVCGYTAGGGSYSSNSSAYLFDSTVGRPVKTTSGCPGNGVASTATPTPSASASASTGTGTTTGGTTSGGTTSGGTTTASATPTATSTPTPTPTATAATWIDCAGENATCSFTGTRIVRYGIAPSSYAIKTLTDGTPCTNSVFGDPAYGYAKTCSYQQ